MSAAAWLAFVAAAAFGAVARYVIDVLVQERARVDRPWGTFVVNVTGSFVLGVITGLVLYRGLGDVPATVLGTGFCGAFTTFSTFTFETVRLAEAGELGPAAVNVAASVVSGVAAAALGMVLAGL